MTKAVRAIITNGDKTLMMHRNKYGSEYFTLVGGRVNDGETLEQALVREIREETGLTVTAARLVFYEQHPAPYNEQYIYLCEVASTDAVAIQEDSEEGIMNRYEANIHRPMWVSIRALEHLAFRTPQLHQALIAGYKKGFPKEPIRL